MTSRASCLAALLALTGCGAAPVVGASPATAAAPSVPAPAVTPTVLMSGSCRVIDGRADARCTPGALNPDVTEATTHNTICAPAWTETVQPPADYIGALKIEQMRDFGEAGSPLSYKEDHLVPVSLGGAPKDPRNLFPQPTAKTTEKEDLEDRLHKAVCSNQMTLTAAQAKIRRDWTR